MAKVIDLNKTVYEIYKENPEVLDIMKDLGFKDIATPGMINTAGRFMKIPKGAALKGVDYEKIKQEFINRGYEIRE